MNLPDLKHLKAIISLCKKTGVESIKIDNVEIKLRDDLELPKTERQKISKRIPLPTSQLDPVYQTDAPTMEDLINWSSTSGGEPVSNDES